VSQVPETLVGRVGTYQVPYHTSLVPNPLLIMAASNCAVCDKKLEGTVAVPCTVCSKPIHMSPCAVDIAGHALAEGSSGSERLYCPRCADGGLAFFSRAHCHPCKQVAAPALGGPSVGLGV
jgi:hypothetical protein